MSLDPIISIVTATYNRSEILKYTIKSVLNQNFNDWELIIIGDCCTDNTEELVKSFDDLRIKFHNLEENFGEQSGPNNYGVKMAKGKYIAFLNHDDIWFKDHLDTLLPQLEEKSSDLIYSWFYPAPVDNQLQLINSANPNGTHRLDAIAPASTWLFRKELYKEVGPWRSFREVYGAPSQDWLARVFKAGKKINVINKFTVVAVQSGSRKNSYKDKKFDESEKYYDLITNNPFFREEILNNYFIHYNSQHSTLVFFFIKKAIINLLKKTTLALGIRPVLVSHFIRHRKKGAFINKLRKTRGLKKIK